jgi:hypothetical protein
MMALVSYITRVISLIVVAVFVLVLNSCGTRAIVIDTDFPAPLVKKVPLTIGVIYSDEFKNHRHEEDSEVRGERDWIIETGKAQVALFDQLLNGVFEKIIILEQFPSEIPPDVDAVFSPLVEDLQIAVPKITKINVFEVWIRYNLRMFTPEGEVIADWIMSAYGKTPTRFLKSQAQAVEQATKVALRDGGANFIIGFNKVPEVRRWLEGQDVKNASTGQ